MNCMQADAFLSCTPTATQTCLYWHTFAPLTSLSWLQSAREDDRCTQHIAASKIWLLIASEAGRALQHAFHGATAHALVDRLEELIGMRITAREVASTPQASLRSDRQASKEHAEHSTRELHAALTYGMLTQDDSCVPPSRVHVPMRLDILQALVQQSLQRHTQHAEV